VIIKNGPGYWILLVERMKGELSGLAGGAGRAGRGQVHKNTTVYTVHKEHNTTTSSSSSNARV